MPLPRAAIAIWMSGFLPACGGGDPCAGVNPTDGLTVDIATVDQRRFPDGIYEVAMVGGGLDYTPEFLILDGELYCPGLGCNEVEVGSVGPPVVEPTWFRASILLGDGIRLVLRRYIGAEPAGGPPEVSLTLRRDGVELGSAALAPVYARREIGPGCGFETTASERMVVALAATPEW